MESIDHLGGSIPNIELYPLICEIEADLPMVIEKFSNGESDIFNQRVRKSSQTAQTLFSARFPFVNISSGLFGDLIPNLNQTRASIADSLTAEGNFHHLPNSYKSQLHKVATEREYMFFKLYGAEEYEDRFEIAVRQMISYLAVFKELSIKFPQGVVLLNRKTPNQYYLEQDPNLMRTILELTNGEQLPKFKFF